MRFREGVILLSEVIRYLSVGKENAVDLITLSELMDMCPRNVGRIIHKERANGTVICSSTNGYYLPANKEDIREFVESMQKRATSIFSSLKSAKKYLNTLDGQEAINTMY